MPNIQSFSSYNDNCGNVTNSYNNITLNKVDEDNQIKQWLSPLTPQARHQAVQTNRVDGVGSWLLEKDEFKQWLSPLTPQARHQTVQANRVDGAGRWLLEKDEFREWSGSGGVSKQAVLFCYGHPGVGKTHIR